MTFRTKAKSFVRGDVVENAPEAIRLFAMCEGMKWNHLPVAGGIYDQHPELLRQWNIIWEEKAEYESKQAKNKESGPNVKNR